MAKYCRYCGRPVRETAKFCPACGKALTKAPAQTERVYPKSQRAVKIQRPMVQAPRQAEITQMKMFAAPAAGGELDFGEVIIPGLSDLSGAGVKIPGPFIGILQGISSFIGGIFSVFRKPAALIGTVLFAVLWFVLAQFRGTDSEIIRILSWLTFSEGGFDRSVFGMLAGALGKGTVAAALISLFTGGLTKLVKGIGVLFAGNGEKRSIFCILAGVILGGLVCFAFTGKNASADTAMAGIAGVLLPLETLGGSSGKLYKLAQSLTSRIENGVRTPVRGRSDSLLIGLTLGFTLATVLSSLGVLEGLL